MSSGRHAARCAGRASRSAPTHAPSSWQTTVSKASPGRSSTCAPAGEPPKGTYQLWTTAAAPRPSVQVHGMAGDCLNIDLASQSFMRDPFPTLTRLREAGPVVRVDLPFLGKTWIATTYDAVNEVLKDD